MRCVRTYQVKFERVERLDDQFRMKNLSSELSGVV